MFKHFNLFSFCYLLFFFLLKEALIYPKMVWNLLCSCGWPWASDHPASASQVGIKPGLLGAGDETQGCTVGKPSSPLWWFSLETVAYYFFYTHLGVSSKHILYCCAPNLDFKKMCVCVCLSGSHYITQVNLWNMVKVLLHSPQCWGYRYASQRLATQYLLHIFKSHIYSLNKTRTMMPVDIPVYLMRLHP